MKLTIKSELGEIDVLGKMEVAETIPESQVYLDDKRVPPVLEKIILAGLDVLTAEYCDKIEQMMKEDHLLLREK